MKIVCISDTHGKHDLITLPSADMIIHAGDISSFGLRYQVEDFLKWFSSLNYKHKIFIAGNHDFLFEQSPKLASSLVPDNVIYLEESGVNIEGIKIWGTPMTPYFFNWAFNRLEGSELKSHMEKIPRNLDILISHGPPFGILDKNLEGQNCGSLSLLEALKVKAPKNVIFGHIHEGYGKVKQDGIRFINASSVNRHYEIANKPHLMTIQNVHQE